MENSKDVSLTISKELVTPIVQAKINEAILSAMGGQDQLIQKAIDSILNRKVDSAGNVSRYDHENKYNWLDAVVTEQIRNAVSIALKEILATREADIKAAIMKNLSSKKGIEAFAQALLSNTTNISDRYHSTINVEFKTR